MSTSVKQSVIHLIEGLPRDVTIADIVAELYLHEKVQEGLRQLDDGQGVDHEDAKQRLGKWLS
jgi:predicted transcriptional regulator